MSEVNHMVVPKRKGVAHPEKKTDAAGPADGSAYSKMTKSLCPHCMKVIEARVFEKDGKILITKRCSDHGSFEDVYWSDAAQFKRFAGYHAEGDPIENPQTQSESKGGCPQDCGLCDKHQTRTMLANVDVTNRCNQNCPICFANSATAGYLYEPSLEKIREILEMLRNQKPVPVSAIQFSGGEPTVHPKIVEIISMAKEMGFEAVIIASNGVRIAEDINFAKRMQDAGLRAVYLQFDGITPEPYIQARGYNALPMKQKAVENLREIKMATVLVPTVVKGVNDGQLGGIIDYGMKNLSSVKGVNFQPVAFTGRIENSELRSRRITVPDVMRLVEEQTDGRIHKDDWLPVPALAPLDDLLEKVTKKSWLRSSVHAHCGAGLFIFEKDGDYVPLSRFMDLGEARRIILDALKESDDGNLGLARTAKLVLDLAGTVDMKDAPSYFDWKDLAKHAVFGSGDVSETLKRNGMFIGCMHFMDPYNFDVERVERCCIHYATPDMRLIPFCAYNTLHRENVEKKFSVKFQKNFGAC